MSKNIGDSEHFTNIETRQKNNDSFTEKKHRK